MQNVKRDFGMEPYLIHLRSFRFRTALKKLHSSDYQPEIETGYQKKIPNNQRNCPFCVNEVENKNNFLVKWALYDDFRMHYRRQLRSHVEREFPALVNPPIREQSTTSSSYIVNVEQRTKSNL